MPGLLIKLLQVVLYLPIQAAFIPFAMIGLIAAISREMRTSRKLGVSFTAIQALQYRWIMHYFDTRPDAISVAFIKKFPCESHFGLWSTLGGLIVAQRLFGFTTKFGRVDEPGAETVFSTPGRRVLMFDAIVEEYVDQVEQLVISGAGFDLVALHFTNGKSIKVFELDQVETLQVKVETLEQAGLAHHWITYVPVDYSRESWVDKLVTAGFDKTKKTLFLWQSVSLFLEPDAVTKTLREMAGLCAEGSIIAQDLYSRAFVSGQTSSAAKRAAKMAEKMGEPWRFGLDMTGDPESATRSFLEGCGLRMTRYVQFGKRLDVEPFYCVVEAESVRSRRCRPARTDEPSWRGIPSAAANALAILLLTIGAGACATPKPLPPVTWEGERIRHASTVGRLPCGDSLPFMDRRVKALQTALDEPMSSGEKITYYWLPGRMELSPCPRGGDCAEGLQVFSRTLFHDHEIVHVLLRRHGRSLTFLYEGLAEAYGRGGGSLTAPRAEARAEVLRSLTAGVDPRSISYPLAGLFVRYLIETHGFAAIKRLYTRSRADTDIVRLQQLLEQELGSSLDAVLDRFVAEAPDCYPRMNLCAGEPVPWRGGVWRRRLGLACRSPGVLEIAPGMLRNESLIEIPERGAYRISASASSTPIEPIVLAPCTCQPRLHRVEAGGEATVQLERGRYRVLVGRHAPDVESAARPVQVTIRALSAKSAHGDR